MIPDNPAGLRPAVLADRQHISRLLQSAGNLHRHLDWRSPLDWLGTSPFFVIEAGDTIRSAFACPPDPPRIAWVRLFACAEPDGLQQDWADVWSATRAYFSGRGETVVAAISLQDWFEDLLQGSGFSTSQSIVMLEREQAHSDPPVLAAGVSLRPMMYYDLPQVAEVDASGFELLWQNSLESLQLAFKQAVLASVAEADGRMIGYQLSTRNPFGIHLARLAVRPEVQRQGIGRALVCDLIEQADRRGTPRLTVNTQSDNSASLSLYARLGFKNTGEAYPVFTHTIGV
jgi:ribosomal protein S18 acetylase RimI-like enzyme